MRNRVVFLTRHGERKKEKGMIRSRLVNIVLPLEGNNEPVPNPSIKPSCPVDDAEPRGQRGNEKSTTTGHQNKRVKERKHPCCTMRD